MFDAQTDTLEAPAITTIVEMQRALVGGLVLRPEMLQGIALVVQPEHFSDVISRTVYRCLRSMAAVRKPIDDLLLAAELKRRGDFDAIGGVSGLNSLVMEAETDSALTAYANEVLAVSLRAKRVDVVTSAYGKLVNDASDSAAVCNDLIAELGRLAKSDFRKHEARTPREIIADFADPAKIETPISTGYPGLDELCGGGIARGGLVVIGAAPSVGKTQFTLNLMAKMAVDSSPARTLFISLEMAEAELVHRLIAMEGGLFMSTARKIMHGQADDETERRYSREYEKGVGSALALPLMIVTGSQDTENIREIAMRYEGRYDVLIVDYLQRIGGGKGQKTLERVEAASRALKDIAVDNKVPVIAVASLNRDGYRDKTVKPDLAHLRECGNIEFDADYAWMLWRDKDDVAKRDKLELHIRKQRNGPLGMVEFVFDLPTGRIAESVTATRF